MAKYHCGSFGAVCNKYKKDIKAALQGKFRIECDMDNGEVDYKLVDATPEECREIILGAFDEVVFQALGFAAAGRVLERILAEHNLDTKDYFKRYIALISEESNRFNEYEYENFEGECEAKEEAK